jgi:hypothetical protein
MNLINEIRGGNDSCLLIEERTTKKYGIGVVTALNGPSMTMKRYTMSLILSIFVKSARKREKKGNVGSSKFKKNGETQV